MTEDSAELRFLKTLGDHEMLTVEQQKLLVTGLGTNAALAALGAATTFQGDPALDYLLELPNRRMAVNEAIAWLALGESAASIIIKHEGDIFTWAAALPDLEAALPGIMGSAGRRMARFALLLKTVLPRGFTPERLMVEGKMLMEQGVAMHFIYAALKAENPVPVTILTRRQSPIADVQLFREGEPELAIEHVYACLANDIDVTDYRAFRKSDAVATVEEMLDWRRIGVTGRLAQHFVQQGESKEYWRELADRLRPFGANFPILYSGTLRLRTMAELLDAGQPPETVVAWSRTGDAWEVWRVVGQYGWLKLRQVGCTLGFLRQFHILLSDSATYGRGEGTKYALEEESLLDALLRIQTAGVNEEWARRYKVYVNEGKQLLPSDYIKGWQEDRAAVR